MKKANKRGFTIVELVIVVAVIAILAAVLIPTFSGIIAKAQQSADQQLVRQINTLLAVDAADGTGCADISEVKELLSENGYNEALVPAYKGYIFGFIASENTFVLIKDDKVVYPENCVQDNLDGVEIYEAVENLIVSVTTEEGAEDYINTGSLKNGYIELASGTYENLKYGYNIGNITSESTGTSASGITYPRYYKTNTIGNLTIGGNGATLEGFYIHSGDCVVYDPEGIYYVTQTHIIETLKFKNVTFTGSFTTGVGNASITNLVFENVTFDMSNVSGNAAAYIYANVAENVTFKNCKFINGDELSQYIQINSNDECAKKVTVDGCEFDTIGYNAINISGMGVETLVFTNNTVKNTENRGIRVNKVVVKATVRDNTLINATDATGEAIKIGIGDNAVVVVENNTLDGNAINWTVGEDGNGIGK